MNDLYGGESVRSSSPPSSPSHKRYKGQGKKGLKTLLCSMSALFMWLFLCASSCSPGHLVTPVRLQHPPGIVSLAVSMGTIVDTLPEGDVFSLPYDRYTKDVDGGWTWGNSTCLSDDLNDQLKQVVRDRKHAFAYSMKDITGYKRSYVKIPLKDESERIWIPQRRESQLDRDIKNEKCSELLDADIIEPSNSHQFACATTQPAKKDAEGNWVDKRFCVDLRPVNTRSIPDKYGMHHPDDLFQMLADSVIFTKIDLRSGFHQLVLHPDDKQKTSFWWNNQLWCFKRLPYGYINATAEFQKVMDAEIAAARLTNCARAFVDDVIIHSRTPEEHVKHVAAVLDMLASCGLFAHPEKSIFGADVVEYLGHNVSKYGISPMDAKVAAIKELPIPSNVSELRSVLGFTGYYRQYVRDYSAIANPLNKLLQKGINFTWTAQHDEAFQQLKDQLCRPGVALRRFDYKLPTLLYTDWSNKGLGAVLTQLHPDGKEYLVGCISRSLNKHERNYSSPKGETLAAVWAMKVFRPYLHGIHFKLVTDHQALKWILTTSQLSGQFARWALSLMDYDFEIEHRAGTENVQADTFSRFPRESTADNTGARLDEDSSPVVPFTTLLTHGIYRCDPKVAELALITSNAAGIDQYAPRLDMWIPDWLRDDRATEIADSTHQVVHDKLRNAFQQSVRTLKNMPVSHAPVTPVQIEDQLYSVNTTVLGSRFTEAAAKGVVVIELFGGLLSGVEMLLRNDVPVTAIRYSDINASAQTCAQFRATSLATQYPHLLDMSAVQDMFSLPQDVRDIQPSQVQSMVQQFPDHQFIVVGGWECQDLSPAGSLKGLEGAKSSTFYSLIKVLSYFQQFCRKPPGYVIENTAFQHNFLSSTISSEHFQYVCSVLGTPVLLDAARFGSYAHRLRNFWTNLADTNQLQALLSAVHRTPSPAQTILDPGRFAQYSLKDDRPPFYPANKLGQPLQAFPTLVAARSSYSFRNGKSGQVFDTSLNAWTELTVNERERALGYDTDTTAAPGLSLLDRHVLTGSCIDANTAHYLLAAAQLLALNQSHIACHVVHSNTTLSSTDLHVKYGPGFDIMHKQGWRAGQALGRSTAIPSTVLNPPYATTSRAGIGHPLSVKCLGGGRIQH